MEKPETKKLMDIIDDIESPFEEAKIDKIKVQKKYYEILNEEYNKEIRRPPFKIWDNINSILGIPIEVDDKIQSEYEVIYKDTHLN